MISKKTASPRPVAGAAKTAAPRTRAAASAARTKTAAATPPPAVKKVAARKAASVKKPGRAGPATQPGTDVQVSAVATAAPGTTLTEVTEKVRKPRLVRDSFTMSAAEYALLGALKQACLEADYEVKKSELLRVGIALVARLEIVALKDLLAALAPIKSGRVKKT